MNAYTHKEAQVTAFRYSVETEAEAILALGDECAKNLFAEFAVEDQEEGPATITFRYKTNTVATVMKEGDYLVKLSEGMYVSMNASTFESQYGVTEAPETPTEDPQPVDGGE